MSARASQIKSSRPATRDRNLRLVKRRRRRLVARRGGRRIAPAIATGAVLIAAAIFAVLLTQVVLAESSFRMARMRDQLVKEEGRHARLVLKTAKMNSAERIERVAVEELGMVYPERVEYIVANVRGGAAGRLAEWNPEPLMPADDPAAAMGNGAP